MAVTYKDIDQLTQKATPTGAEKLPVSDTEYITPADITGKSFRLTEMTPESTKDGYYLSSGGSEYESSSFEIHRYAVSAGKVYALSGHFTPSVTNIRMILWLNASGSVLKNDYNSGASGVASEWLNDRLIVPPIGAVTLAVNVQKSNSEYFAVKETDLDIAGMVEVDSTPSVHSENPVQNKVATETFIRAARLTYLSINDGYMKIDGTTAVVSSHSYAKYEVTPGKTYMFSVGFYTGYSTGQMRAVIWLDSSNNVLSYSDEGCNKNEARHYLDAPIKAPANAAYAVLNSRTTYVAYPTLKALSWSIPEKTSELTNDSGYLKYVLLADEAAYNALATKDPGTLYLIPEV